MLRLSLPPHPRGRPLPIGWGEGRVEATLAFVLRTAQRLDPL